GSGHIWQRRHQSFPIQQDEHLLTVLRYIERNPVRAKLAKRAEQWSWSSARYWEAGAMGPIVLTGGPTKRPAHWLGWVNQALTVAELESLRRSVSRGTPSGSSDWAIKTSKRLGLEGALRPRGRPRKKPHSNE